jgi:hypothetical protein
MEKPAMGNIPSIPLGCWNTAGPTGKKNKTKQKTLKPQLKKHRRLKA